MQPKSVGEPGRSLAHPFFVGVQLKNFNSLRGISFLAAVMSLGYSTIAFGLTMKNGK